MFVYVSLSLSLYLCAWKTVLSFTFTNTVVTPSYTFIGSHRVVVSGICYFIDSVTRPIVLMFPVYYCASKMWITHLPLLFVVFFPFSLCSLKHTLTLPKLIRANTLFHSHILCIVKLIGLDSNIVIFDSRFWQSKKIKTTTTTAATAVAATVTASTTKEEEKNKQTATTIKQSYIWTYLQIMTNWKIE